MQIVLVNDDGAEWETITVNPKTLAATDDTGDRVSLFGAGADRDGVASLREIIEAGLAHEATR